MGARHFGLKEESVYGTAVVPDVFFEALDVNMDDKFNSEEIKSIRSFSTRQIIELNKLVRGDATVQADYQTISMLLYLLIGDVDTSGAGPYTHTFPGSTGIPAAGRIGISATLEERRDGTLAWAHAGCKLVGFGLSVSVDAAMRAALSWVGKSTDNTITPVASPTYLDFDIIKPGDVTVKVATISQDAKSFSLNVGFPVDEPYSLGDAAFSVEPGENDVLAVAGSFEVYFVDKVEYDIFTARTDTAIQPSCTNGTESLTINLNKCRLTEVSVPVSGRERLVATFSFVSFFDTIATENFQAVVVNDVVTVP